MATSAEAVKAEFADILFDLSSGELTRNGRLVRLQAQPSLVLRLLLDHAGEVVTREELQRRLWPHETFVDFDQGLNKAVGKLRDALDDLEATSGLIQTIPRKGYRFNAKVNWTGSTDDLPVSEPAAVPVHPHPIRYWLAGCLAFALLLAPALWLYRHTITDWMRPRPVLRSVAVLPLINISDDTGQEYLADGITEELIADLSYAKSLRVISHSSSNNFKKSQLSVPQIAEQLNVDAVIEGAVLRANKTIRVSIRLIAARPERQLWAASYERNADDAAILQKQIAADAVYQIRAQLTPEEQNRLKLESRISPEAYDEYLQARFFLHEETGQRNTAIPHLERAIQLDPNFASAYAALGEAWALEGVWAGAGKMPVREAALKGLEYSQKALSLDPASSEGYTSLGHSLMQARRWNDGEVALRKAMLLDPNNTRPGYYLAVLLVSKGRPEESVALMREIAIANPVAVDLQRNYAAILFRARRYDDSLAQCERVIHLNPDHLAIYATYANVLVEKGRYQEADAAFRRGKYMSPGVLAWLYVREGNREGALKLLKDNPSPVNVHTAVARYLLGDQERGLAELDFLANEQWNLKTYSLRNDPLFDPMRKDPRFIAIVKKTGLYDN